MATNGCFVITQRSLHWIWNEQVLMINSGKYLAEGAEVRQDSHADFEAYRHLTN